MPEQKENSLKKRIIDEMTVDHSNALERNFDLAKQFIGITKDGKVAIPLKDRLPGKEVILLYLLGKLYAKAAGFAATSEVANEELLDELGIRVGSLLPWLKELRDNHNISQIRKGKYTYHAIKLNEVEKTLGRVAKRLEKRM